MSIPPGDSSSWALLHDHLTQAVMALADGHRLTIEAPEEFARPGRISGLRRVLGQKHPTLTPWVTLERLEDHLIARCVSDDKEIGFPLTSTEKEHLDALGWHRPGPTDGPAYVRWIPDDVPSAAYLPEGDAQRAASLAGETLRTVFGVDDARSVVIRT